MKYTHTQMANFEYLMESTPSKSKSSPLVFGVAVNDAGFQVSMVVGGSKINHRAYSAWKNMLNRCYNEKERRNYKTYSSCLICNDWHSFKYFLSWWKLNHVDGWHMDKDILSGESKIYSPETCVFIPNHINKFITLRGSCRGLYPLGVSWHKRDRVFTSHVSHNGRLIYLGCYASQYDAHNAWLLEKLRLAKKIKPECDSIHDGLYKGIVDFIIRESKESLK